MTKSDALAALVERFEKCILNPIGSPSVQDFRPIKCLKDWFGENEVCFLDKVLVRVN